MVENESGASPGRFGLPIVLAIGGLLVAAGVFASFRFMSPAGSNEYEPPLPRPRQNAPFVKTPDAVVDKMVEVAALTPQDHVYDLGCGDGRIVITAAMKSGCRGTGFDIDPQRVAEARENVKAHDVEKLVTIEEQDVFKIDLSRTNIVMLYLLPKQVNDLKPQFDAMPSGSRIVSHDFWLDGIRPELVVDVPTGAIDESPHKVILYKTPLEAAPDLPAGKPPGPEDSRIGRQEAKR